MITIGFSFDDFDLIVHSFQLSGMDGIITVIQDAIAITLQSIRELPDLRMLEASSQRTPFFQGFFCPGAGLVLPNVFQFVA